MKSKGGHILTSFGDALRDLRGDLIAMGALVELQLESCRQLLEDDGKSKRGFMKKVAGREVKINRKELEIYADIVSCFSRNQPMARDVRLCVGYLQINTDLERIGDEAEHVVYCLNVLQASVLKSVIGERLRAMLMLGLEALQGALSALAEDNRSAAQMVIDQDIRINELHAEVEHKAIKALKESEVEVEDGVRLIQVARALERVGDHSKNLSQAVIYALTGEDPRSSEVANKAEQTYSEEE